MATAGEMKALRKRIVDALGYGPLKVVNYSYNGIRINYAEFRKVATAVSKNVVHVLVGGVPGSAAAMYVVRDEGENSFVVPDTSYGRTLADKLSVAHEAVHCILDYKKIQVPAVVTETAAYITTGILEMYANFPLGSHDSKLTNEIFNAARKVASVIVDQRRTVLDSSTPEVEELEAAIMNHPEYGVTRNPNFTWGEDGVKGM